MWVGVVWWGAKVLTCEIVWKTEKMGHENNDRHGEAEVFYFGLDLVFENMSINRLRYLTPNHTEKINKQIKSKSKKRERYSYKNFEDYTLFRNKSSSAF